jgi:glycosyltransferase involved in cell wall biosynthesis
MAADVTVAIPVYNGGRYLDEVLAAVRAQRIDRQLELLIVDSGSSDGSLEIAERHGARIYRIEKSEFSHGGTRNRMMELAEGEHVAFLSQDATPAHDGWLAAMLNGFDQAADVALVFGPHLPRPGASHMIEAEMERHFATWGDGRRVDIQRLERTPAALAAYRQFPGKLTFFSDVNGCVARWAWQRVPYRRVPYAEDQLLGREMIEAGFAKVFHPDARVRHSHDYPPAQFLRRYFDEFRSLREVLHHTEPAHPLRTPLTVRGLARGDERWLRAHGVEGAQLRRALGASYRHHAIRQVGAIVGSRADRVPRPLRRVFSLEGRDTFTPHDVPESPLLAAAPTQADSRPVPYEEYWEWEFILQTYPSRPVRVEPHSGDATPPWTLAWVVPAWTRGSGGHTTIFRLIRQMELRGHRCSIFVIDPHHHVTRSAAALRDEIREHFVPGVEAEVFRGLEDFDSADVAIATEWRTAFPVRDLPRCREKVYLVQDHEPEFFATSSQSTWAEETYAMGYRCIAYTPWMAKVLEKRYGLQSRWFECGTDLDVFPFAGPAGRENEIIAVYARRETERRAVELAVAGLALLARRRPTIRPVLFGSNARNTRMPFIAEDLRVVPPRRLSQLYREAAVGLVFSLTTHSLVAHEMMSSGLPTVELEGDNVSSALGPPGELVEQAARRPDAIADAIERLLDDREHAAGMARRARAFVEARTWERAGDQVQDAIRDFLRNPR